MPNVPFDRSLSREMKRVTRGMMPPKTYEEYYRIAAERSRLDIIDIGVGRGASSISYALGVKQSGRAAKVHAIDIFFQLTDGPHRYNTTDYPDNCVEMNVAEVRSHIKRFDVEDIIVIWPQAAAEVAAHFPKEVEADVLTIDVDGSIDRELRYFFDRVERGGLIVLDDHADIIDRRGRTQLEKMMGKPEGEIRAWIEGLDWTSARRIIGKQVLTYRLAKLFEKMGMIKLENVIAWTAFYTKTTNADFDSFDLTEVKKIEESIVDDFIRICR